MILCTLILTLYNNTQVQIPRESEKVIKRLNKICYFSARSNPTIVLCLDSDCCARAGDVGLEVGGIGNGEDGKAVGSALLHALLDKVKLVPWLPC